MKCLGIERQVLERLDVANFRESFSSSMPGVGLAWAAVIPSVAGLTPQF
jgi:hypothetical protein